MRCSAILHWQLLLTTEESDLYLDEGTSAEQRIGSTLLGADQRMPNGLVAWQCALSELERKCPGTRPKSISDPSKRRGVACRLLTRPIDVDVEGDHLDAGAERALRGRFQRLRAQLKHRGAKRFKADRLFRLSQIAREFNCRLAHAVL